VGVVDLDPGIADRAEGDWKAEALEQPKVDVDVEPLRLETGEAASDGLEPLADGIEVEFLLGPSARSVPTPLLYLGEVSSGYGTKRNGLGAHGTSGAEGRPAVPSTWRRPPPLTLSRQSRNQTGGRRQDSSSAVRAILDDPPIHIRPVCSRKRGCEGQEPCGFNAFQHAHGCTPPPPRPQDSSHVLSRVSS
jgi:hypothetical protein